MMRAPTLYTRKLLLNSKTTKIRRLKNMKKRKVVPLKKAMDRDDHLSLIIYFNLRKAMMSTFPISKVDRIL